MLPSFMCAQKLFSLSDRVPHPPFTVARPQGRSMQDMVSRLGKSRLSEWASHFLRRRFFVFFGELLVAAAVF
jgi:hypothetical protein